MIDCKNIEWSASHSVSPAGIVFLVNRIIHSTLWCSIQGQSLC